MALLLTTPNSTNPAVLLAQVQDLVASLELLLSSSVKVEVDKSTAKSSAVFDHTTKGLQVGLADKKGKREYITTETLGAVKSDFLQFKGVVKLPNLTPSAFDYKIWDWFFLVNTSTNRIYIFIYTGTFLGPTPTFKKIELT